MISATLALVLLLLGGLGYLRGYHLELFQPGEYGAVEITLRVEKGRKDAQELYLAGTLYEIEEAASSPVFGGALSFHRVPEDEVAGSFVTFRSARRQLPPGEYRVELEAEQKLTWKEFTVVSLAERSRSPLVVPGRPEHATQLLAEFEESRPLPLDVSFLARDVVTGGRVENATLLINIAGRWRRWTPFIGRMVQSGGEYSFRLTHPDYRREELSLSVAPDQTSLHLEFLLTPEE